MHTAIYHADTRLAPGPYRTVADVKRANAAIGHHYFDRETLRFFGSRVGSTVYGGRYFVTSERDEAISSRFPAAWNGERRYTVREAADDGSISTVGAFGAYRTGAAARKVAEALAADRARTLTAFPDGEPCYYADRCGLLAVGRASDGTTACIHHGGRP
jgi:hypothetical protein